MKKTLKSLAALLLAFSMSINVMSLEVFAAEPTGWFEKEFPDEIFRKAIIDKLNITDESKAQEMIVNFEDDLIINGAAEPAYANLEDITGIENLGLANSVVISNTLLSKPPKLEDGEEINTNLMIAKNRVLDLSAWKDVAMGSFNIRNQFLIYVDADQNIVKRDEIGVTDPLCINLQGQLKLPDGKFPHDGYVYDNGDGKITWSNLNYENGDSALADEVIIESQLQDAEEILLRNVKQSGSFQAKWLATNLKLGLNSNSKNQWSGTVTADFKVIYKHDISLAKDAANLEKGAVVFSDDQMFSGKNTKLAYYEYKQAPQINIAPEKGILGGDRRLQAAKSYYVNTVSGEKTPIQVEALGKTYAVALPNVEDVNHVFAKFTHIPAIQAIGNGEVKGVSLSTGNFKEIEKNKTVVAEDIHDGDQVSFSFKAADHHEVESITVNDKVVYEKGNQPDPAYVTIEQYNQNAAGINMETSVNAGTVQLQNIQKDDIVKVNFKAIDFYNVKSEVIANGVASSADPASTTMDDGMQGGTIEVTYPDQDSNGHNSSDIYAGENRIITIKANEDYKIQAWKIYDVNQDKDVTKDYQLVNGKLEIKDIHSDFKISVQFVAEQSITTAVTPNKVGNEKLDDGVRYGGKILAKDEQNIAAILRGDNRVIRVIPNKDAKFDADGKDIGGYLVETVNVVQLVKNADGEWIEKPVDTGYKILPADEKSGAVLVVFDDIRANYKVKASFIATNKVGAEIVNNGLPAKLDQGLTGGSIQVLDQKGNPILESSHRGDENRIEVKANSGYQIHSFKVYKVTDKGNQDVTDTIVDEFGAVLGNTTYAFTLKDIWNDYKVDVSFVAVHQIDVRVIPNGIADAADDGTKGCKIKEIKNATQQLIGGKVYRGDDASIHIVANDNYRIHSLSVDGKTVELKEGLTDTSVSLEEIKGDHLIEVSFQRLFDVTTETVGEHKSDGGTITDSKLHIPDGDAHVVVIKANKGFMVDEDSLHATGGQITKNEDGTIHVNFEHVNKDEHIEVGFIRLVNVTTENLRPEGGTITESESNIKEHSDKVVVIKPNPGFVVDEEELKEDGGTIVKNEDGSLTITFEDLTKDKHVVVSFKKTYKVTTETVGEHKDDGGTITKDKLGIPEGNAHTVVITPNKNFIVDEKLLESTGGKINKMEDGSVSVVFEHMEKDEHVKVGFLRAVQVTTENLRPEGGNVTASEYGIHEHEDRMITVTPNPGYVIDEGKVKEDGGILVKNEDGTMTITFEDLIEDKHVVVSFKKTYNVTTETVGEHKTDGGSISKDKLGIPEGDAHTVIITPNKNFIVDESLLESTGGKIDKKEDGSIAVIFEHMEKDEHVKVGFIRLVDVTTENLRPEGGTITDSETGIHEHEERVIIITPNPGFVVDDGKLKEDGGIVSRNQDGTITITFKDLTENKHVVVSFKKTYDVTTETVGEHKTDGGSISKDKLRIPEGDAHTVIITPNENFIVDESLLESTGGKITKKDDGIIHVVFDAITKNEHVKVGFVRLVNLTTENLRPEGGMVSESEYGIHEHEDKVITVTPKPGFIVDVEKVKEDGGIIVNKEDGTMTITFKDMTEDKHVVVSFKKTYKVTTETVGEHKDDGGTISKDRLGIPEGDAHTVIITPNKNFIVDEKLLESTGGTITKEKDGTVIVEFEHMEKDEHVKVGFLRQVNVTTENQNPDGGMITDTENDIPEHHDKVIIVTPKPGYQVDEENLKNDGGTVVKNEDGSYTITFKDLTEDKYVVVNFVKIPVEKPKPAPEKPQPPKTGDTTGILPWILLAILSGLGCIAASKKRRKAKNYIYK